MGITRKIRHLVAGQASRADNRPQVPYTCNLDSVGQTRIMGWAFDAARPDYKPVINVLCDDRVIGKGSADVFRQDLANGGFGDGRCGFNIAIEKQASTTVPKAIMLVDAESGLNLLSAPYSLGGASDITVSIDVVDETGVSGKVVQREPGSIDETDTVCIFVDDEFACSTSLNTTHSPNEYTFSVALPANLFDSRPHVFVPELAGKAAISTPHVEVLHAITTPWEYLATSHSHIGYASLSRIAAYRYDSLQNAMGQMQDIAALENIQTAHALLVEGPVRRKQYPALTLPSFESPVVSVIVPVFNQFETTYHCIASCILNAPSTPWELILVDDCSTDTTTEIDSLVKNLQVVRNTENQGFLHSCNRGAEKAAGDYLLFLNNDTEVTRGWLDELLDPFKRFSNVGATGSKLVYPDGSLQDAGGIVWESGTPWNVGHGGHADDPQYNYAREVDYLTGAALMVSKQAWQGVGGFSESYAPAYYEDTDIAFKLRASGFKTVYAPKSTVIHYEGKSNGTDTDSGVKHYQVINAEKFVETWQSAFTGNGIEGVDLHLNKDRNRSLRVLMIDHAFPCEGLDAGSYAAIQEIRLLQALGCKVTFVPHNFTHLGKYTDELQRMGVECIYAPFYTSVDIFLHQRGGEFDAVYITRYDVAERVLPFVRQFTTAKVMFNNADLHFLREMRSVIASGATDLSGPMETREREVAVMNEVDAILSYNETEHEIIASHIMNIEKVFKCPWVLEDQQTTKNFSEREGIAFLGGFGHPPNREAVLWFVDKVIPLIKAENPSIRFHIYGSRITEEIEALAGDTVVVEGFVEDLEDLFDRHRVFVAPLLSGAGIKGKVLDSIAYGLPAVLSPVAAEATGLQDGSSAFIPNNEREWCQRIVELYQNEQRWSDLRTSAARLLETEYSFAAGVDRMQAVLDFLGLKHTETDQGSGESTNDDNYAGSTMEFDKTVSLTEQRVA